MRLELKDITKQFPGVLANDRISISADKGEVLGLLGENGAGKTTLMNILSGLYRPDSGEILIDGTPRQFHDPAEAIDAGIGMVHQHFQLVPVFDVVSAVALGAESVTGPLGTFDRAAARKRVVELSEQYSLDVPPDADIEDLPVGVRQRVEILKALYRKSDILVLDEPSAVLTPAETEELFDIIRELAASGTTVIFITHKLNEVLQVADRITVLRRGRVAGTVEPKSTTREQLANLMVGRDVELRVVKGPAAPGDVVLSLKDVVVRDDRDHIAVKGVTLDVRAGEIVAIAGVQGNGQTELVEAIVGLRTVDSGSMSVSGADITAASPRQVSDIGVAHIPEDRGRDGLISPMTVSENYILDSYHRPPYSRGGRLNLEAIRDGAGVGVRDFDIRTPSIHTLAGSLSGGNQQKVVVAREFSRPVKLVIAAQPTRGLDVGSIEYIHKRIVEQRDAGAAILIVSTELEEVLAVGDRVAVMFAGKIVGILEGDDATFEAVGMLMGGAH
ncbi:MAG TPA: ABC transporter ATP-binding protein [Candidatus Limnocylindrales bacterium]|jgi:general nucleoside transport system ATP-binding protein|nr:ABC transporter ATP-binding protein [Candidatus Limnocylindrales bacterium]